MCTYHFVRLRACFMIAWGLGAAFLCTGDVHGANIGYVVDMNRIIDGQFDMFWSQRLTTQGHTILGVGTDQDPQVDPALTGIELFIISNDVNSAEVGTKYTAEPRPIINWEEALLDELGISSGGARPNETTINIVDCAHPAAGGLCGAVQIYSAPQGITHTNPELAPGATIVAQLPTGQPVIVAIEAGGALLNNPAGVTTAPGRRLTLFAQDGGDGNLYTPQGLALLDAAINYSLGLSDLTPGDVNGDGQVLIDDFEAIRTNFRTGRTRSEGDLNFDGQVNLTDFQIWKNAFSGGAAPNGIPEPGACVLFALAAISALAARRRWYK